MNMPVKVSAGQRLSAERMHRRWTQLEVADRLGTTPGNVSRWERGMTSPGPYFRRKLCDLFGKSSQELGLRWDESDDPADHNTHPSSSVADCLLRTLPSRSTPCFSDSEDLKAHMDSLLGPDPLNLPDREHSDQEALVQAIMQWLQARSNLVLIVDKPEAVVIVASKEKVC